MRRLGGVKIEIGEQRFLVVEEAKETLLKSCSVPNSVNVLGANNESCFKHQKPDPDRVLEGHLKPCGIHLFALV